MGTYFRNGTGTKHLFSDEEPSTEICVHSEGREDCASKVEALAVSRSDSHSG